jgi:hypothetical protein
MRQVPAPNSSSVECGEEFAPLVALSRITSVAKALARAAGLDRARRTPRDVHVAMQIDHVLQRASGPGRVAISDRPVARARLRLMSHRILRRRPEISANCRRRLAALPVLTYRRTRRAGSRSTRRIWPSFRLGGRSPGRGFCPVNVPVPVPERRMEACPCAERCDPSDGQDGSNSLGERRALVPCEGGGHGHG